MEISLRADTAQGYYVVAELGIKKKLPYSRFSLEDAYQLAEQHLEELARKSGVPLGETQIIQSEEFNMIRGFSTVGKIITCRVQVKPGVLQHDGEGLF